MEALSPELLAQIAELLDPYSIQDVSLVSRHLAVICEPYRFRKLKLLYSSPESLSSAVTTAIDFLRPKSSFKHVQHLEVLAAGLCSSEEVDFGLSFRHLRGKSDRPLDPFRFCYYQQSRKHLIRHDSQWQPLAELVAKDLPALKVVTWGGPEQIPVCILKHLHTLRPRVALNMCSFNLRSLCSYDGRRIAISPADLELATSPCLHSIVLTVHWNGGGNDHNLNAIDEMIAGGAPHLKKVHICWFFGFGRNDAVLRNGSPRQTWRPGTIRTISENTVGSLESIHVLGSAVPGGLMRVLELTNPSTLCSLNIHQLMEQDILERLTSWGGLTSLEDLTLTLAPGGELAAKSFILSLPPLRRLRLYEYCNEILLCEVTDHCGQRLRLLHCMDVPLTTELAGRLLKNCPHIEDLRLNIYRQDGSGQEVALYHCLGRFQALHKVELGIHLPQIISEEPRSSELALSTECINDTLNLIRNLAFDQDLARSIFHAIASTKRMTPGH